MSRKVLITGVSRGLGKVLAEGILQEGHRVVGCARTISADQQRAASNDEHFRVDSVDLSDDTAVEVWIDDVVRNWGVPDLVINNAGVINENLPLWEVPFEQFQQVLNVNLQGVYSVIRHITPHLLMAKRGVIANVSSGWGRSVAPGVAPYCASKWGIEGMSLALAEELPEGLASVSVNPGVINTDMLQSFFGADASQALDPELWASRAVAFFLALGPEDNGKSTSV